MKLPFSHCNTTLSELHRQKLEALEEVRRCKTVMQQSARLLLEGPETPQSKGEAIVRAINLGMAALNGMRMGKELIRRMRTTADR